MIDEADQGYRWEAEYEKTWELLQEDEAGSLQASVDDIVQKAKRRRLLDRPLNVKLGIMRHLCVVIDMSDAMNDKDLRPNRQLATLKLLEKFVEEFFDQNPISQLGLYIMKNKRCELITELGGNIKRHTMSLANLRTMQCQGEASLQNAMELTSQNLRHVPGHASREILIILGSLSTCDPGNIVETAKMVKSYNVRCSIIGLAAGVYVCQKICQETQGKYNVILDESHFRDLLTEQTAPPPAVGVTESSLIRMGFPQHETTAGIGKSSMCMCHIDSKDSSQGFGKNGYFCPQCWSKYCELPVECVVCGLTLVSAPHLARSYHHLFPLQPFVEISTADIYRPNRLCYSCQKHLSEVHAYKCDQCSYVFCIDCDVFIHEIHHCCPGCASKRTPQL